MNQKKIEMIRPPYLQPNDSIGIVSTARKISLAEIQPAIIKLKEWGLNVILGKHLFSECHQFAGNDEERTKDLQQMMDDPGIKAIVCARGGYGTVRIVDSINFQKFINKPKWIVGYSDVTVLHSHIHCNYGIETLHATMPLNFPPDGKDNSAILSLKQALFGEAIKIQSEASPFNRKGQAAGIIVGGNLSVLYSLTGSSSDINTKEKILFIEDLDEYLYHIDRMMMNYKRSGKLASLAGLIIGGMTEMKDNMVPYGKTAYEIIKDAVSEYDYPVCFGFPAGHMNDNRAMILGRKSTLKVDESGANFIQYP